MSTQTSDIIKNTKNASLENDLVRHKFSQVFAWFCKFVQVFARFCVIYFFVSCFLFLFSFVLFLYFGTLQEQNPYFLALCTKNNPDFFSTSRLFCHFARTLTRLLQFLNLQERELLRRFGASFIFFISLLTLFVFLFFFLLIFLNFILVFPNFFETLRLSLAICK